jgi:hypothetical protein
MLAPPEDARPFNELSALIKQEHTSPSDLAAGMQKLHRFSKPRFAHSMPLEGRVWSRAGF